MWKIWMTVPTPTVEWCLSGHTEGLMWYDGWGMNFWYALNHEWYRMNNKQFAFTGCSTPYEEPRDFYDHIDSK